MRIFRSLKSNLITQGFGENKLPIYKEYGLLGHNGLDWLAKDGEPLYFDCDIQGKVIETHIDNSGGLGVVVITEDTNTNGIFKHRYWHLKQFAVKSGQIVDTGDLFGWADNTGRSTGTHLHRDLKELSSWNGGNGYRIKNYDNGYKGAINIRPFYDNIFVLDKMAYLDKTKSILTKMVEIMKKVIQLYIQKNKLYEAKK